MQKACRRHAGASHPPSAIDPCTALVAEGAAGSRRLDFSTPPPGPVDGIVGRPPGSLLTYDL